MRKISKVLCFCLSIFCIFSSFFIFSACSKNSKYVCEKFKNISYGNHERQTLNLYLPKGRTGTVGLVLFIHGGSWSAGDKSVYDSEIDSWCKTYGYATASINYRFASADIHVEDILQDIASSLQKIKEFANKKNVNIEKVLLTGHSAGAHLSLLYAYKCANQSAIKPVAVASFCAPTDLTDENYLSNKKYISSYYDWFSKLTGETITSENMSSAEIQEKLLHASPINFINENLIPTLICHGLKDDIVPYSNATTLKNRLDFCGVRNELVTYPSSGHTLGNDKKQAKQKMVQFAKEYLN